MKRTPLNFPLLLIVLGFIFGIIFQDNFLISINYSILLSFISVFLVYFSFFILKKYTKITTFTFSFFLGILLYSIHYEPNIKIKNTLYKV